VDAADALKLTDKLYWRLRNRRFEIERNEAYYNGEQKLVFASDEWIQETKGRYSEFSDNWCASIVDAVGERTNVIGLKLRGDGPDDKAAEKSSQALWDQWNINELDAQSSQGFLTSFNSRRSYVLVWNDPEDHDNAQITWEHPSNVEIEYDWMNPRRRSAAIKTWVDEETEYANLYTATEVFKYERPRAIIAQNLYPQAVQMEETGYGTFGVWKPREVKGETWPLKNPMNAVPIVEIPNRPLLRGEPVSEITKVIPMQNAINLLWSYLFFAADYASLPARVLLATQPPMRQIIDSITGEQVGVEPVSQEDLRKVRFATFSSESAKIDQWDAADLKLFTDVIEIGVGHIAAQTRTPPTYLVANGTIANVSADGLKAAEIGLVKKTLEFQKYATPNLREMFRLTALAQGDVKLAKQTQLSTIVWQNPEIRSEAQLADALLKKRQLGYPLKWIMELDGIDPYDMERIEDMLEEEAERNAAAGTQAAVNALMNQIPNANAYDEPPTDEPTD
jgi:hypothetical protein